jgi:hypothetical protein
MAGPTVVVVDDDTRELDALVGDLGRRLGADYQVLGERSPVAALPGPQGEPPGRGVLSQAGVRLAFSAAPATDGRWGLGYGLGLLPGGDLLAYHEGANRPWRAGLALLPDSHAGIVALANGHGGSSPIDAVVQQWVTLAMPSRMTS